MVDFGQFSLAWVWECPASHWYGVSCLHGLASTNNIQYVQCNFRLIYKLTSSFPVIVCLRFLVVLLPLVSFSLWHYTVNDVPCILQTSLPDPAPRRSSSGPKWCSDAGHLGVRLSTNQMTRMGPADYPDLLVPQV